MNNEQKIICPYCGKNIYVTKDTNACIYCSNTLHNQFIESHFTKIDDLNEEKYHIE